MKLDALVAEIGSTTTVINGFTGLATDDPTFVGQGQAKTSVEAGDVRIGVEEGILDLCRNLGIDREELVYDELFATSSAAGGLKMTVHGLVFDMTARAAKEAALGAGAVLHLVTAGKLRRTDLKKLQEIDPNLILIAGGVDYGERDTALENAEKIVDLGLKTPVIYAGNIENQEEIRLIFDVEDQGGALINRETGQELYIVENVYPKIDYLNVEPTRKVIQDAFENHIREAHGMEHIYDVVDEKVLPTPGAVLSMAKLVNQYLGNVVVVDVGGATTDIHSVADDTDGVAQILVSPEPKAKRTVEGDLGLYVNMEHVIRAYGEERMVDEDGFDLETLRQEYDGIPKNDEERRFAYKMAEIATVTAMDRHAGKLRFVYGPSGRSTLAEGKDLTNVRYIIGTGGALTQLADAEAILHKITLAGSGKSSMHLLPKNDNVQLLVDHDYIMASLGVLALKYERAALRLLEKSLRTEFNWSKD